MGVEDHAQAVLSEWTVRRQPNPGAETRSLATMMHDRNRLGWLCSPH
jgi:hypothetical protein